MPEKELWCWWCRAYKLMRYVKTLSLGYIAYCCNECDSEVWDD